VGKTSLLIAAARAMESSKPEDDRLFIDPYPRELQETLNWKDMQKPSPERKGLST
jgi:O-methyltransferase involved in polyketide biosynthesis